MGQIDSGRGVELIGRDVVQGTPSGQILCQHTFQFLGKGLFVALLAAENVVEDLAGCFILIFRHDYCVPALPQVVGSRSGGSLEGGNGLLFLMTAAGARQFLILEDQKETPGDSLTGTKLLDQPQAVLLQHPAVWVCFLLQLPPYRLYMAVDIRALSQHLELHLDRGNFQITDKGIDDTALFLGAAEQEIDRNDFHDLYIAVVSGVDHTLLDFFDGNVIRQQIERCHLFLRWKKRLVLGDLALFPVEPDAAAADWHRLLFLGFLLRLFFTKPAWQY